MYGAAPKAPNITHAQYSSLIAVKQHSACCSHNPIRKKKYSLPPPQPLRVILAAWELAKQIGLSGSLRQLGFKAAWKFGDAS